MINKSLYHINKDHLELMVELETAEGELTPELEQALAIGEEELHEKSDAYVTVIKGKEATIEMLDNEIKRLTAMKKSEQNQITRLKQNLLNAVNVFGKFDTGRFKFAARVSQSVEVLDIDVLSDQFITTVTTEKPDKTAIKNAIKAGEEVNGATLINNTSINIK